MIRFIIALLVPWLSFFTMGKWIKGIICLALQLSVVGWLPAAIWAVYELSQYNTDKKIRAMQNGGGIKGKIVDAVLGEGSKED